MRYSLVAIIAGCVVVLGCAPIVWDKPGVTPAQFAQDSARCQLVAKGMNSGDFYAEGKPEFVAGAALGNAIGTAVARRADYKNCMIAAGYTERSPEVQAAVATLKSVDANYISCVSAAYNAAEADPIRQHSPFRASQMTAAQLIDPAFVTEREVAAIDFIHPKIKACQQTLIQAYSVSAPRLVPVWQANLSEGEGDISALRARKMT